MACLEMPSKIRQSHNSELFGIKRTRGRLVAEIGYAGRSRSINLVPSIPSAVTAARRLSSLIRTEKVRVGEHDRLDAGRGRNANPPRASLVPLALQVPGHGGDHGSPAAHLACRGSVAGRIRCLPGTGEGTYESGELFPKDVPSVEV